jgi:hypothetical protein
LAWVQPVAGTQASVVQVSPSLQLSAVPGRHAPAWQVSLPLQRLPSVHEDPFGSGVCVHPLPGLHPSAVQTLPSSQSGAVPGWHVPPPQTSTPLQALPSLQLVPLARSPCWQMPAEQTSVVHALPSLQSAVVVQPVQPGMASCWQPATGSQLSVVHALPSPQFGAVPAMQLPAWQVSAPLHALPSPQAVPLAAFACWQRPALQASVVQALASSHCAAVVHD